MHAMNDWDPIVRMKSIDGQWRSYREKNKRAEMMEQVFKAINSFSRALQVVSCILKFHAISLTTRRVA